MEVFHTFSVFLRYKYIRVLEDSENVRKSQNLQKHFFCSSFFGIQMKNE